MKKRTVKQMICFLLVGLMTALMVTPVYAGSKSTEAKEAYKNLLERGADYWIGWHTTLNEYDEDYDIDKFALIDMDKNGVPELVVTGDNMYHSYFYAYVNGKVKLIGGGFSGYVKFYPNKKLIISKVMHMGCTSITYYKFNGKKLVKKAESVTNDVYNSRTGKLIKHKHKYYKKGKKVKKAKYKSYVKKLKRHAKKKKLNFYKASDYNYYRYL